MADKILLKTDGPFETVSAFNHVYPVVDGYCVVDVTPYHETEPHVAAERDAAEICRMVAPVEVAGMMQVMRPFRPATQAEVAAWQKAQKAASKADKSDDKADKSDDKAE